MQRVHIIACKKQLKIIAIKLLGYWIPIKGIDALIF